MNKSQKIDNYCQKLLEYRNSLRMIRRVHALSSNNYPIKKIIENIVNNNNDYLLTNSFLYFLAVTSINCDNEFTNPYSKVLYEKLCNLNGDKESIIKEVFNYLDAYHTYCIYRLSHDNYTLGYDLTINVRKFATAFEYDLNDLYNSSMIRIEADDSLTKLEYNISKIILNIFSSISFYEGDIEVFKELSKPFLENTKNILDELKMNGLFIETNEEDEKQYSLDNFINYFINTPLEKNKKLIK